MFNRHRHVALLLASHEAALPLLSSASRLVRRPLQLRQQRIESLEICVPNRAISFEPRARLGKRLAFDSSRPPLRLLTHTDQPRTLEYFQMFGNCRLAHRERCCELRDGRLPAREARQDGASRGIRKREEGGIEAS